MIDCVTTTNGITGADATVCAGDVTLQLTAGGVVNAASGFGLQANNNSAADGSAGLYGREAAGAGMLPSPPNPSGVWGDSQNGIGVVGSTASVDGVYGVSMGGPNSTGVHGLNATGGAGVRGRSDDGNGVEGFSQIGNGVIGVSNTGNGVYATSDASDAVYGQTNDLTHNGSGVFGNAGGGLAGVTGFGYNASDGVRGESETFTGVGVHGLNNSNGTGVWGESVSGDGVGVEGTSVRGRGVVGGSLRGIAVAGFSQSGTGVLGVSNSGWAGDFRGRVRVTGFLLKAGGGFQIDHPVDPQNKYLNHFFVESAEMKNVYDGVAVLNARGQATVQLPKWFDSLNRDFRYQLTPIGGPAPNLHVADEIQDNRFKIAGGEPGMKVSWQVTGSRKDKWAKANQVPVEERKKGEMRGRYLHAAALGKSEKRQMATETYEMKKSDTGHTAKGRVKRSEPESDQ